MKSLHDELVLTMLENDVERKLPTSTTSKTLMSISSAPPFHGASLGWKWTTPWPDNSVGFLNTGHESQVAVRKHRTYILEDDRVGTPPRFRIAVV